MQYALNWEKSKNNAMKKNANKLVEKSCECKLQVQERIGALCHP